MPPLKAGADGDDQGTDVMKITNLGDLCDTANPSLTLAEAKRLLTALAHE